MAVRSQLSIPSLALLLTLLSVVGFGRAAANCNRFTGTACHYLCSIAEQQVADFSVIGVGNVLGLDLITISWRFEVLNHTMVLPYRVAVNQNTGEITLPDPVDYDTSPRPGIVHLTVRGTPIGTSMPGQTFIPQVGPATTCTVQIDTLDRDDNLPQVDPIRNPRTLYVPENTPVGTVIGRFYVVDGDSGQAGEFRLLRIAEGSGIEIGVADPIFRGIGTFDVSNVTGEITLIAPLDAESRQDYQVAVTMRPVFFRPDTRYAAASINIRVVDVDEFQTQIVINPFPFQVRHDIDEGLASPVIMFQATLTDEDQDPNLVLSVENALGDFVPELAIRNHWFLMSVPPLDRERTGIYNLTLVAHDMNSSLDSNTSRRLNYTIRVLDRNDNNPRFTQSTYHVVMPETTLSGTVLTELQASDPDLNDDITYSLAQVTANHSTATAQQLTALDIPTLFTVGIASGELRLARQLDYEILGPVVFTVTVTAISSRNTSSTSTAMALVNLQDRNDEKPIFASSRYTFQVTENTGQTSVGKVQATDRDTGRNGVVFYSIEDLSGGSGIANFRMDATSGEIFSRRTFDREIRSTYNFLVIATDDAEDSTLRRRGLAEVTVQVTDVADSPPVFPVRPTLIQIPTTTAQGDIIYQLSVTDADTTISARNFSITAQKDSQSVTIASYFQINVNGSLVARQDISSLPTGTYVITIRVQEVLRTDQADQVTITLNVTMPAAAKATSSSVNLALIIGVAAGAVAFCILVAVILVLCNLRLKKNNMKVAAATKQPSKSSLVFLNNMYSTGTPNGKDTTFTRPATLPIGSNHVGDGLAMTPRSDPEGSAFTPGSFNEPSFMGKSRNRAGMYEAHSGSDKTPNSRESYNETQWDRRQSVRTSASYVDEPDVQSSSGGRQSGGGLATIEPSPTSAHVGKVPTAPPVQQVRYVSQSAELSHRPQPAHADTSKSAMHMRANNMSNSPRSGASTRSQSTRYSATPPNSAQGMDANAWQPLCFKPPVATPALVSHPIAKEHSNGSTPASGYRATPPSRQRTYSSSHSYGAETVEPNTGNEQSESDDMHFYPAGYRPRRRPGSSSQNSSHSGGGGAGTYDEQRYPGSDNLHSPMARSQPIVIEMGESEML